MKKLRIDAVLFLVLIALLGAANFLHFQKPSVSLLENRALKKKPALTAAALLDGSYMKDYEDYYSDTFILRDSLVKLSRDFQEALNIFGDDVSLVTAYETIQVPQKTPEQTGKDPAASPAAQDPASGTAVPSPTPSAAGTADAEKPDKDFGDGQNVGYWLVVDGKAVQLFKFNKESFEYYAQVLNKFSQKLGSEVKIYSMIPPTNGEFLRLKKYKGITDSQNDALDFLNSKLDSSISSVNVYDALNRHTDDYIYFRTDHHWTALGAYYAYEAFINATGDSPVALDRYESMNLGDFLGSSYAKTLDKKLEKNPDQVIVYKPFTQNEFLLYDGDREIKSDVLDMKYANETNNKYLTFLSGGGATWSVIKTDVKNGRKLLVIKDSFGNALVPFLIPHYEEIYVVDPRFYSIDLTGKNIVQFVRDKGINEVLFCIYMEDVNWHKFMSGVENLLGSEK